MHRWPVLLPLDPSLPQPSSLDSQFPTPGPSFPRKRGDSLSAGTPLRFPIYTPSPPDPTSAYLPSALLRGRSPSTAAIQSVSPDTALMPTTPYDHNQNTSHPSAAVVTIAPISATHRARRASAAEKVLEQLRSRDLQKSGANVGPAASSPRTSWIHYQQKDDGLITPGATTSATSQDGHPPRRSESRRQSLITPIGPPPSPVLPKSIALPPSNSAIIRQRPVWSPSGSQQGILGLRPYPAEFLPLLDGEHHTDELAVRFEVGWPVLESWLVAAGGGTGDGDLSRIRIIYR